MGDYIECAECGFTLLSETDSAPEPKRWESCPDCDGTDFRFLQQ